MSDEIIKLNLKISFTCRDEVKYSKPGHTRKKLLKRQERKAP